MLLRTPYIESSTNRVRVLIWYFYHSYLSKKVNLTNLKIDVQRHEQSKNLWGNMNLWLRYQVKYIDPKFWAQSPAVQSVSNGHTQDFWKFVLVNKEITPPNQEVLYEVATRYSQTFEGYDAVDFFCALGSQKILFDYCRTNYLAGKDRGLKFDYLVEIGAGFGWNFSMVLQDPELKYKAIDTPEMGAIQRFIQSEIYRSNPNLELIQNNPIELRELEKAIIHQQFWLCGFWSFSEISYEQRSLYLNLIRLSKLSIFVSNNKFDGIDNLLYFKRLSLFLSKNMDTLAASNVFGHEIPKYMAHHKIYILT